MNRAERIFRLHRLLGRGRPVSKAQIMESLEVSASTVKRDVDYMRTFMDAPIVYDREANGYRYDPDAAAFELPGLWFSETELYALLATQQLLEAVQPRLLGPQIGPLKARIRRLLARSGHSDREIAERIQLQPFARRRVDDDLFGTVASALLNPKRLQIDYEGRERGADTRRIVHPQRLVHYRDNWYLAAHCELAADRRLFALDRVRAAAPLPGRVRRADPRSLDRFVSASFGIFTGAAKDWAVLRFVPRRARWVADESWHPDQIGVWKDGAYELQVPFSDTRELLLDILKYGSDVEVLAPSGLRRDIAQELERARRIYGRAE